jgi:hypothetical protein
VAEKVPQVMSETEKPKRSFWQFHLSTAVALMITAGCLLPFNIIRIRTALNQRPIASHVNGSQMSPADLMGTAIVFSALVLFLIAFVCEWLIRRREARKT